MKTHKLIMDYLAQSSHISHIGLIVLWLIVPVIFQELIIHSVETRSQETLQYRAHDIADGLINGLNMLMSTAAIIEPNNRQLLLKKMNDIPGVDSIQVIRAQQVVTQYGVGLPEEQITDDLERSVISSKTESFAVTTDAKGHRQFRAIIPFITSRDFRGTDCLACHEVQVGSVNGAANIVLSMSGVDDQIKQVKEYIWVIDILFGVCVIISVLWERGRTRLQFLANHDDVTKLPNRLILREQLSNALQLGKRNSDKKNTKVATMFIDLDDFKKVNDRLGHHIGDVLLRKVADILSNCVRASDIVARLGGDEFIVVLVGVADNDTVIHVVNKIYNALSAPIMIEQHELSVSVSIGISMAPEDGNDTGTLIKNADVAMYRAKRSGKGRYQFYNADVDQRAHELLTIEHEMIHAAERNEFILHYQPQISTTTGRIIGVESLVRWQHPTLGLISPGDFIPIAESSRLIIPIGIWVMTTACEQIVKWHQQGFYISMSINLSPVQVEDPYLGKTISNIISTTGADPKFLIFELTEAVLAQHPEDIHTIFQPLRDMGAKLSIDDFGTGYSSLSYLKKLPVDAIKIDQSFIRDMMAGDNNGVIVTAIVSLAHSLQLNVVAEGIETDEQYKALQAVGCDEIQGFLFSRPKTADDVTKMLAIEPTSIVLTSTPE